MENKRKRIPRRRFIQWDKSFLTDEEKKSDKVFDLVFVKIKVSKYAK